MHGILVMASPRNDRERVAWLAARGEGISASEIAAALGISPWDSPFSLYWRKRLGGDVEESPQMEWGTRLEDAIAAKFADAHPEMQILPGGLYRHPRFDWMLATPDRLIVTADGAEVLECKTAGSDDEWGEEDTDGVPDYYRAQVMQQLDVMGLQRARIALLIRGSMYREYVVDFDAEDAALGLKAGEDMMRRLAFDDVPNIDGSTATTAMLKRLHPSLVDGVVSIPADLAARYRAAKDRERQAKADAAEAGNQILDVLGAFKTAVFGGDRIAYRSVYEERRVNITRLKAERPDIYAEYAETSTVSKLVPAKEQTP
jgi:putative phage-type endonuclease